MATKSPSCQEVSPAPLYTSFRHNDLRGCLRVACHRPKRDLRRHAVHWGVFCHLCAALSLRYAWNSVQSLGGCRTDVDARANRFNMTCVTTKVLRNHASSSSTATAGAPGRGKMHAQCLLMINSPRDRDHNTRSGRRHYCSTEQIHRAYL